MNQVYHPQEKVPDSIIKFNTQHPHAREEGTLSVFDVINEERVNSLQL
jgi:hypothetical protein